MVSSIIVFMLSALAIASPVEKRDSPLSVILSATENNAVVEAAVTNNGATDLSILKAGSLFEDAHTQKVTVSAGDESLEFQGVRLSYDRKAFTKPEMFTTIKAGETVKTTIELGATFDLTKSDNVNVAASGTFQVKPASELNAESTADTVHTFTSNTLPLSIDTAAAAKTQTVAKMLRKRVVKESCSGAHSTSLTNALSAVASRARTAATGGTNAQFQTFFKTTSASTKNTVTARLNAVASAAAGSASSVEYFCTDPLGFCDPDVLAYTVPSEEIIANCNIYYTEIPANTNTCHAQDQWTTSLHELTHAPAVFSPGTQDLGYGFGAATSLSTSQAVLNADTYALYAQTVVLGC